MLKLRKRFTLAIQIAPSIKIHSLMTAKSKTQLKITQSMPYCYCYSYITKLEKEKKKTEFQRNNN